MLGSWYTPREIGKRAMVFWLAGSIGQMFSGFLQAAAVSGSELAPVRLENTALLPFALLCMIWGCYIGLQL